MKKKSFLKTVIALFVITQPFFKLFAQAPNISYGSPVVYNVGATITPVAPVNSGGSVPATIYGQVISDSARNNFGLDQTVLNYMFFTSKSTDAAGNGYGGLNNAISVSTNNQPGPRIHWNIQYWVGGTLGNADGIGTDAQFGGNITSVAFDKSGDLIVADVNNGLVRKVSPVAGVAFTYQVQNGDGPIVTYNFPAGRVSTLPGHFLQPLTVAVDGLYNVYVYDNEASKIYKISTNGSVSELAGSGASMVKDGIGSSASFYTNGGMAVDDDGNVYVYDSPDPPFISLYLRKIITTGYSITPALPAGLSFDSKTGTITGTPTTGSPAADYIVTAYNSSGSSSATINVKVNASADLSKLSISNGVLSPAFATSTTSYAATVSNATSTIAVTPTANDAGATIKVDNVAVASGTAAAAIPLNIGPNIINIVITGSDGLTTKTYALTITRAASTNAALTTLKITPATSLTVITGADYRDYATTVPNEESSVKISPVAQDATASIKVNGVTVASGATSAAIPLNVGDNVINTVVIAQDGITTKTYSIKFTRLPSSNASLAGLTLSTGTLSPVFAAGTTSYTASVSNATASVTVTPTTSDAGATIKVNGTAVAPGSASAALPLTIGQNIISTVVTAQDGVTTKTYTITVTVVPASNNAILSSLKLTPATSITVIGGPDYRDYATTVPNSESTVKITPITQDATATIKVNGVAVISGSASAVLPLAVGQNVITTVVTAQDGATTQTYTVTVARVSNNAILSSLKVTPATTITLITGPDYRDYATTVPNSESTVKITPTAQDATATIKVNGVTVVSGIASASIPLNVGDNVINTVVTASDGITVKIYSLKFTRQPPAGAALLYTKTADPVGNEVLTVHQNLSPNGDGNSDVLVIDGIAAYPDNSLQIMSRNGALVYEVKGYDNATKAFDGHSSTNGKLQQAGTYFYSLEYKDGNETKYKTGFIVLKY